MNTSIATWTPFQSFWSSPWSIPLRGACNWLQRKPGPVVPDTPDALAPSWVRPLCLQRLIGKAIRDRIAWNRQYPDRAAFLYPEDSIPVWTEISWTPYSRAALRSWSDEWLLIFFPMELERLQRLIQTPPSLLGEELWTRAALGACQHLAQMYHELRRRYHAKDARLLMHRLFEGYVFWEPPSEEREAPAVEETRVGD